MIEYQITPLPAMAGVRFDPDLDLSRDRQGPIGDVVEGFWLRLPDRLRNAVAFVLANRCSIRAQLSDVEMDALDGILRAQNVEIPGPIVVGPDP